MATRKEREAEELRRRRVARRRFKTLVRIVMYNRVWLLDMEEQKLSLNVKRNIAMLIRPHRKIGILTLPEKTLLRTQHYLRTIKDRKRLVTLFSSLTCFSHFPPKVRARLVPVTQFADLQKNRFIIREGAEPHMIYFILYGEVEIYRKVYKHLTKTYEDELVGLLGTGDCVGEIEFLENLPRRLNSYVTSMDTEVLIMVEEDFERILKPVMYQEWIQKKTAIKAIHYFDFFNEDQLIVACKLGLLRQFDALETICHEDKGLASYVYFVISGECMILQCLSIKTITKDGNKTYVLQNVSQQTTTMFEDLTNKELMKKLLEESKQDRMLFEMHSDSDDEDEKALGISLKPQKTGFVDIETLCAVKFNMKLQSSTTSSEVDAIKSAEEFEMMEYKDSTLENITDPLVESKDSMTVNLTNEQKTKNYEKYEKTLNDRIDGGKETSENDLNTDKQNMQKKNLSKVSIKTQNQTYKPVRNYSTSSSTQLSTSSDSDEAEPLPAAEEEIPEEEPVNHFIDVGAMTFGGIFGLGEKMDQRVIMARTTVQCLLLPRFWLLAKEQNPGNVWQRRRFYLDHTIPSRQTLFKNFLATLKWQKFKKDMITSILDPKSKKNPTKVEDIPIICRITEGDDK